MEIYKFFNDGPGDPRAYQAADFADYFGSILSNGFLQTNEIPLMEVNVEEGTLQTVVSPGKAIIHGHLYENTSDLTLTHTIPEPTLDRIDRIVLRLDLRNSERNIKLHVKSGVPAEKPVEPALQRDNFIYELALARVLVRKNTVQLLVSDLVDERMDEAGGGLFATAADFAAHKAEDATLLKKGHVQLNSSVTSTSETLAATSKAVKTAMDRADEAFQSASDGKTAVASAITAKGVTASPTDTFPTLATKVGQINTGKKYARGTVTSGGTAINFTFAGSPVYTTRPSATVTDLPFRPKRILIYGDNGINIPTVTEYSEGTDIIYPKTVKVSSFTTGSGSAATLNFKGDVSPANVTDNSFTMPVYAANKLHTWEIYGE